MTNDIFPINTPISEVELGILRGLVDDYCQLDDERARLENEMARAKAERDKKAGMVLELMARRYLKSHKFLDGLMVISQQKTHISIPEDSREKFHSWLKAHGYWNLARINAAKEVALLRERLEVNAPIPDYCRIFKEPAIQLRGRKKKGV